MTRPDPVPRFLAVLLPACAPEAAPTRMPGEVSLPLRGMTPATPLPKVPFVFPDTEGERYDFVARTEGKIALLFFGYTYCPDVCPVHMATLAAALAEVDPAVREQVEVVFVSVDPERDTPERLRAWLATFDSSFVGVRPALDEVAEALAFYRFPPPERSDDGPVYTVGHPALTYGFTPDGLGRALYAAETPRATWEHDLSLMAAYPWEERASPAPEPPPADVLGRAGDVDVLDAYAPESVDGTRTSLYLTLRNRGSESDSLVALSSPAAARAGLHETRIEDGVARMAAVSGFTVPPGGSLLLRPGGPHGMLEELRPDALRMGAPAEVTLHFARGGSVTVPLRVVRYADLVR